MNKDLIKKWKKKIKSKLKKLQVWRDRTFHQFGMVELESALSKLGIKASDTVFVHSSFDEFRGFLGKPTDVIQVLQNLIGPKGAIMMPTMAFTGTAVDYALLNPMVDNQRLQSRMGLITELFRRIPDVLRSLHPTHPIAVWGGDAQSIVACHHLARTPCGAPSPLQQLLDRDGKIILLGTGIEVLTFYHTIEEILENKLPVNPFTKEIYTLQVKDAKGSIWDCQTRLYEPEISKKRKLDTLLVELKKMNAMSECRVGKLQIQVISAKDVLQAVQQLLDRGLSCYA